MRGFGSFLHKPRCKGSATAQSYPLHPTMTLLLTDITLSVTSAALSILHRHHWPAKLHVQKQCYSLRPIKHAGHSMQLYPRSRICRARSRGLPSFDVPFLAALLDVRLKTLLFQT